MVKSGLWLSRRQVRWLIVLLALLPLIPSGLLIQIMIQNAIRDRAFVASEMGRTYRSQLARIADRYSLEQSEPREQDLAEYLNRVFGAEVELVIAPPSEVKNMTVNPLTIYPVVHRLDEGAFAGWMIFIKEVPGLPDQRDEQRKLTVNHIIGILVGVVLVAGGVWFTVHRRLRVDEMRSDLLTTISHEIKTPVAASRVLIETLEDGGVDEETAHDYLRLIRKENDRMTELADQFLTYSRLEQGQVSISRKSCSLSRLLHEQVRLLRPQFTAEGGSLKMDCEEDWRIETDPQAVKLVLDNLIENALKYGGDPPHCVVEAKEAGGRIEISVTDSGEGVDRAERKAIFRKFYQGDAELSRGKSGVGLGLAICRQFARLLRGNIYVADSCEGEGARFVFSIPYSGKKGT